MIKSMTGYGKAEACTNILVSKGASRDGSTMVTYTADSHQLLSLIHILATNTDEKEIVRAEFTRLRDLFVRWKMCIRDRRCAEPRAHVLW